MNCFPVQARGSDWPQSTEELLCRGVTTVPSCWVTKSQSARCQMRSFTERERVELQKLFERDYFSHDDTKKVSAVAWIFVSTPTRDALLLIKHYACDHKVNETHAPVRARTRHNICYCATRVQATSYSLQSMYTQPTPWHKLISWQLFIWSGIFLFFKCIDSGY
jgi:hypothetical protein